MGTMQLFGLEFNSFDVIFLVLEVIASLYCIYTAIRLGKEWDFFKNQVLLPGGCSAEDCTDPMGYFEFYRPKLFLFGGLLMLCALCELAVTILINQKILPFWMMWISILPAIVLLIWFILIGKKATKMFW